MQVVPMKRAQAALSAVSAVPNIGSSTHFEVKRAMARRSSKFAWERISRLYFLHQNAPSSVARVESGQRRIDVVELMDFQEADDRKGTMSGGIATDRCFGLSLSALLHSVTHSTA